MTILNEALAKIERLRLDMVAAFDIIEEVEILNCRREGISAFTKNEISYYAQLANSQQNYTGLQPLYGQSGETFIGDIFGNV